MNKAILFMTFNRLDTSEQVFEQIKIAKPPRLYLASDGARKQVEGESEKVEAVRNWLLSNIDWDCEVKTLFREENLGCGKAVGGAITWFFENEKNGIILEDDCVPNQSFFRFCEELLDKYVDDKRIWQISGMNPLIQSEMKDSYYFAKVAQCWGWATWADRWAKFDLDINMQKFGFENLKNFSERFCVKIHWFNVMKRLEKDPYNTWDYQWVFAIAKENGLCINPAKNMITNIGDFGAHAHGSKNDPSLNHPTWELGEIIHPKSFETDEKIINNIYKREARVKLFSIGKIFRYYRHKHNYKGA